MQSSTESKVPQPQLGAVPSEPQAAPSPMVNGPTANEIIRGFQHADDPLDFIQKNLRQKTPVQQPTQTQITPLPEPPKPQAQQPTTQTPATQDVPIPSPFQTKQESPTTPQPDVEVDEPDDIPADAALFNEKYKRLKTQYKDTKKSLKELESERESLKTRVARYESGEEFPDIIRQKEARIKELEPFEQLINLKKSPAYQEKITKPLTELNQKLSNYAKDYGLPDDVIQDALALTNQADLNSFLRDHFDDVGALEVKQLIRDAQKVKTDAAAMEVEPQKALASMSQEYEAIKERQIQEKKGRIFNTSTGAWERAVTKVRQDGRIQALIPRANDPEFNEKYPKALTEKAAHEFGRLVNVLTEHGLEELPDDVAEALANYALLGVSSAVNAAEADAYRQALIDTEMSSKRTNSMLRPQIGAQGGGVTAYQPKSPELQDVGRAILSKVGIKY